MGTTKGKTRAILLIIIGLIGVKPVFCQQIVAIPMSRLMVSKSGRQLETIDHKPFFWLGDTAWELFNRLTLEEIKVYLDNRAAKGFNVIQITCLSENDASRPNRYGEFALTDKTNIIPNEKYFSIADSTIRYASERNMYVGLVASWGDYVVLGKFDSLKAYHYGLWLGNRYKTNSNIIWIMGGDRVAATTETDYRPIWRAMADGLKKGTANKCIITYHPNGERSSSEWLHQEPWLDFNMIQSSHGRQDVPVWTMIEKDRSLLPVKPTLDGEPNYEDHPINPWPKWNPESGYFRDYDVRKQSYRSVFAGGCGITYGHHAIWQFFSEREEALNYPDRGWVNALDRPGAFQVGYLRKLIESRPSSNRIPDNTLILNGQGEKSERMEAFRDADSKYIMVYLPVTKEIEIDVSIIRSKKIAAWWYNPQTGKALKIGLLDKKPVMKFKPTVESNHKDWVLVIDDSKYNFDEPGL
jgi:hypothetical protein